MTIEFNPENKDQFNMLSIALQAASDDFYAPAIDSAYAEYANMENNFQENATTVTIKHGNLKKDEPISNPRKCFPNVRAKGTVLETKNGNLFWALSFPKWHYDGRDMYKDLKNFVRGLKSHFSSVFSRIKLPEQQNQQEENRRKMRQIINAIKYIGILNRDNVRNGVRKIAINDERCREILKSAIGREIRINDENWNALFQTDRILRDSVNEKIKMAFD